MNKEINKYIYIYSKKQRLEADSKAATKQGR